MAKASPSRADSYVTEVGPPIRDGRLAELERTENFPVALRLLPSTLRNRLQAIYDIARVIDDTGDERDGDRSAQLIALREQLARVWSDDPPTGGVLGRLVPTVRACDLTPDPFNRLIEANLRDQSVHRYGRRADLLEYCSLSADPVGRLVLAIFQATTAQTVGLSDRICTGLQILEHCQDVGEDYLRDRIYLPLEDLARFGVSEVEFTATTSNAGLQTTTAGLQRLIEFETSVATDLLNDGRPLLRLLHGYARLAVAAYLAGGYATADALRRANWQVLPAGPRPRGRDVLRHAVRLLFGAATHR